MVEVINKDELEQALKNKETAILIKGDLAKKIGKKKKFKRGAFIIGGIMLVGGLALVPFSGGTSLLGTVSGFEVITATGATISMTTAEVAILAGLGTIGLSTASLAILKGYSFEYQKDGTIRLTKK